MNFNNQRNTLLHKSLKERTLVNGNPNRQGRVYQFGIAKALLWMNTLRLKENKMDFKKISCQKTWDLCKKKKCLQIFVSTLTAVNSSLEDILTTLCVDFDSFIGE